MQKYSVLMSVYINEKPEFLRSAIESILSQTVLPNEFVIVKDGALSTELDAVIAEYKDNYPRLFHIISSENNIGLGAALNLGLVVCHNELVARMDSDDISKVDRCEKELMEFEMSPDLCLVGSHLDEFAHEPGDMSSSRKVPLTQKEIYSFAKRRNAFNHPTVMFKKSTVLNAGGYKPLRRAQDFDLFGRMIYSGCAVKNIDKALIWFRTDANTSKRLNSWGHVKNVIDVVHGFWEMGYASFWDYMIVYCIHVIMFIVPASWKNWVVHSLLRKK